MQRETRVVLLVLLLAGGALYLHTTTTTEEFSRHNIGWNGTSSLPAEEVRDLARLDPGSTLLLLAPDRPFTPEEVGYLRAFLDGGGRVIIADEEGAANPLLADLGSEIASGPGIYRALSAIMPIRSVQGLRRRERHPLPVSRPSSSTVLRRSRAAATRRDICPHLG